MKNEIENSKGQFLVYKAEGNCSQSIRRIVSVYLRAADARQRASRRTNVLQVQS